MLILTRRVGEVVVIRVGDVKIDVALLGVKEGSARYGIEAPAQVEINREELDVKKQQEKARATTR